MNIYNNILKYADKLSLTYCEYYELPNSPNMVLYGAVFSDMLVRLVINVNCGKLTVSLHTVNHEAFIYEDEIQSDEATEIKDVIMKLCKAHVVNMASGCNGGRKRFDVAYDNLQDVIAYIEQK